MRKRWLNQLAKDIETQYGKEIRDNIFGDIDGISNDHEEISAWFANFIKGLDGLDDKEFVKEMMAKRCPCGWKEKAREEAVRNSYENSQSFEEFALLCEKSGVVSQKIEYKDNVLYLLKNPMSHKSAGSCGKGCHCSLARITDEYISDLFCHCCTVGFDGRPFRKVFGDDIKVEFIESFVTNGNPCKTAVYIPIKENWR
jgi:hypothetical protein